MKNYIEFGLIIICQLLVFTMLNGQVVNDSSYHYEAYIHSFIVFDDQDNDNLLIIDRGEWPLSFLHRADVDGIPNDIDMQSGGCDTKFFLTENELKLGYDNDFDQVVDGKANVVLNLDQMENNFSQKAIDIDFRSFENDLDIINQFCCGCNIDAPSNINSRIIIDHNTVNNFVDGEDKAGTLTLFPTEGIAVIAYAWRYANGEEDSPLDFGTVPANFNLSHLNSNRIKVVRDQTYLPIGIHHEEMNYPDNSPRIAGDVYYTFTISHNSIVTISTNNNNTDFDSFLDLRDNTGSQVIFDDDSGSSLRAVIEDIALDAGEYTIIVDGFAGGGQFELSIEGVPQIPNNDCQSAIELSVGLGVCGDQVTATNVNATDSGTDHTVCASNYEGGDMWFYFVAPANGEVTIETSNDVNNIADDMRLFIGCTSNIAGCKSNNVGTVTYTGLTPGQDYRLAIWDQFNDNFGSFDICASSPATCSDGVQNGDESGVDCGSLDCGPCLGGCIAPIPMTCGNIYNGNNNDVVGTLSPDCASSSNPDFFSRKVWYSFTGDGSTISLTSIMNTNQVHRLYTGNCGSLTCVSSNPINNFVTENGTDYLMMVSGIDNGEIGAFTFQFDCAVLCSDGIQNGNETGIDCGGTECEPCLGECSNPIPITCGGTFTGDDTGVAITASPNCVSSGNPPFFSRKVWYSFIGDGSILEFNTGIISNAVLMIYSNDCDNLSCELGRSSVLGNTTFQTVNGVDYLIMFSGFDTDNLIGSFSFNVTCSSSCTDGIQNGNETGVDCGGTDCTACPLGTCGNPIAITCGNSYTGNNNGIPVTISPNCSSGGNFFSRKVWYSFTGDGSVINIINTTGSPVQMLYTGICEALTCVSNGVSVDGFQTENGTDYLLMLSANTNIEIGPFEFEFICAPPIANDDCNTATMLTVGVGQCGPVVTATNAGATDSGVDHSSCAAFQGGDVWFTFDAPPSGEVTIDISSDVADVVDRVQIFQGCSTTQVACDASFPNNGAVTYTNLTPSQNYRLAIWEEGNDALGSFDICASSPIVASCSDGIQNGNETGVDCGGTDCTACPVGTCSNPITITYGKSYTGNNNGVPITISPNCSSGGNFFSRKVWYSFRGDGSVINIINTTSGPVQMLYTGTCEALTCVSNGISVNCFQTEDGTDYLMMVSGIDNGEIGPFGFAISTTNNTVLNTNDVGPGSLRDVIECASNGDTIRFSSTIDKDSIQLTSGEIFVNKDLVFIGNGPENTIIDGSLDIDQNSRLFFLTGIVQFKGITFQHGGDVSLTGAFGGAIFSQTELSLEDCVFDQNVSFLGAAVRVQDGTCDINRCIFFDNNSGVVGGALSMRGTDHRISNSLFVNNTSDRGGAIDNETANLDIFNCTFANNMAVTKGGAINNLAILDTVANCIFYNNSATMGMDIQTSSVNFGQFNLLTNYDNSSMSDGMNGNISGDPMFVGPNDFQLTATSPSVEAGSSFLQSQPSDLNGDTREVGCAMDMGAYESTFTSTIKTVSNTNDDGSGSLRALVACATSGDTILFSSTNNGDSIFLTSGVILIDKNLVFLGNGSQNTIIDGSQNGDSRLFKLTNGDVFMEGITFQHSNAMTQVVGGAVIIDNSNHFITQNCVFQHNTVQNLGGAVGLRNGTFSAINTKFLNNNSGGPGGAVYSQGPSGVHIIQCLVSDNVGDAILQLGGSLPHSVIQSTIVDNTGSSIVAVSGKGQVEVRNNVIQLNSQGAGLGTGTFIASHNFVQEAGTLPVSMNNSIVGNAQFVDVDESDYTLMINTLGIDAADPAVLPMDVYDIDGDLVVAEQLDKDLNLMDRIVGCSLDMGAFENSSALIVDGCTDPLATNYNPLATCDDGSCGNCLPVRSISGTPVAGDYYAVMTITSDATIESPKAILYQAGGEIVLQANFEVEAGSVFDAQIGDCQ